MNSWSETSNRPSFTIRPYEPEDRPGVINAIKSVYDEYRYEIDFDTFDRDLADILSAYQDSGGEFWVLTEEATVVGMIGVIPTEGDTCELRRLYLIKSYRGQGWGSKLVQRLVDWAREHGFRRIVLWSDVLFDAAHRLYVKHGFTATGKTRAIDPNNLTSIERFFIKEDLY